MDGPIMQYTVSCPVPILSFYKRCYFLHIHIQICSKVPISYFNGPKRLFDNSYVTFTVGRNLLECILCGGFLYSARVADAFPEASPLCDRCDWGVPSTPLHAYLWSVIRIVPTETSPSLSLNTSSLMLLMVLRTSPALGCAACYLPMALMHCYPPSPL